MGACCVVVVGGAGQNITRGGAMQATYIAHGPPGCHGHRGLLRIPAPGFEQRHQKHTRTRVCEPKIWVCTTMKFLFRLTSVKSKTVTPNTNNRAKPGRRPQTWAERRLGLALDIRDYSHATLTENLPISRGRVVAPAAREALESNYRARFAWL